MSLAENVNAYVNFTRLLADIYVSRIHTVKDESDKELDAFHGKVLAALKMDIVRIVTSIEQTEERLKKNEPLQQDTRGQSGEETS